MISFASLPLGWNLAIFGAAALAIWIAGTRMSAYADEMARRTGLGQAFVGFVLLAVATSLPEVATTSTAALRGSPTLVVNNLLGGVVGQTAVLAIADLFLRQGALTFHVARPVVILQGAALVGLLGIVLAGMVVGPALTVAGVSAWTAVLLAGWIAAAWVIRNLEGHTGWTPAPPPPEPDEDVAVHRYGGSSIRLGVVATVAAAVLFGAGWTLASVAEVLAEQTGLGIGFVGAILVAVSTSLPELSTTIAAIRLRAYSMAVSNVFGGNMADVALLFLGDALYRGGPMLDAHDRSATFAAAAGVVVTSVYLVGFVARSQRTVGRIGMDSAMVLALYVGFVGISYTLR